VNPNVLPATIASSAPDSLLTEREAATLTSFSPRTLQGWRQRNQGPPYVRVGRSVRYWESRVLSWLASLEHQAEQPDTSVDVAFVSR